MLDDDLLAKLKRKDWRDPELERQMVNEEIRTAKDLMLLADDDFKSRPKVHARKMHLLQEECREEKAARRMPRGEGCFVAHQGHVAFKSRSL